MPINNKKKINNSINNITALQVRVKNIVIRA